MQTERRSRPECLEVERGRRHHTRELAHSTHTRGLGVGACVHGRTHDVPNHIAHIDRVQTGNGNRNLDASHLTGATSGHNFHAIRVVLTATCIGAFLKTTANGASRFVHFEPELTLKVAHDVRTLHTHGHAHTAATIIGAKIVAGHGIAATLGRDTTELTTEVTDHARETALIGTSLIGGKRPALGGRYRACLDTTTPALFSAHGHVAIADAPVNRGLAESLFLIPAPKGTTAGLTVSDHTLEIHGAIVCGSIHIGPQRASVRVPASAA